MPASPERMAEVRAMRKPKYLQRPKGDNCHYLLRDIPRTLMQKVKYKARYGTPPMPVRFALMRLLEHWTKDVTLPAATYDAPNDPNAERAREQSF